MPSTDLDKDIPFITEPDDPPFTRHYSFGHSLHPSPVHSRSPSFRDDRHLLESRFISASSEELRRYSVGSMSSYHCNINRKTSSKRSRRSQISDSDSRKYVHRTHSVRSSSRSPRPSYISENGLSRKPSHYQSVRRKSSARCKAPIVQLSEEEKLKENRRRRIVYIVIGTTLFLLLCAVLAVVITLTHQSEFSVENKTTTYYTFSPHPKLVYGDVMMGKEVRRENEELMNSLHREHHNSHHSNVSSSSSSSSSVPE